jgi:hypothetical protein
VKNTVPDIHVHAFSPLEVFQGASTLGVRSLSLFPTVRLPMLMHVSASHMSIPPHQDVFSFYKALPTV